MPETSLPVEHLFTVTAEVKVGGLIPNGPNGTRVIVEAGPGTFEGPKMKGTTKAPSGDWVVARPDGSLGLDVRLLLETDDGAVHPHDLPRVSPDGGTTIRTGPLFETGDERYTWLNNVQAVGARLVRRRQGDLRRVPGAVADLAAQPGCLQPRMTAPTSAAAAMQASRTTAVSASVSVRSGAWSRSR